MINYFKVLNNKIFKGCLLLDDKLLTVNFDEENKTVLNFFETETFTQEKEVKLNEKTFSIFFNYDKFLLAYYPLKCLLKVNIKDDNIDNLDILNFAPELIIDNYLYGTTVNGSDKTTSKYNILTNELEELINKPLRIWGTDGTNIYGVIPGNGQELFSFCTKNGKLNWSYIFQKKTSGKLLFYNKSVISLGKKEIVVLDTEKGNVIWSKDSNNLIKIYENKLINIDAESYKEICVETGKVLIEYPMRKEYERNEFKYMGTNSNFTITDTHIYITDAFNPRIGSISRNTGEIDWTAHLEGKSVTIGNTPLVKNENIIILDSIGKIHILKKNVG